MQLFLPSGHFAPTCGCPERVLWLTPDHGWVFSQFLPSPGQRAAGIHPHSAPRPPAAWDHSTPPGRSSSCVCVSWVTRLVQKVRQTTVLGNPVRRYKDRQGYAEAANNNVFHNCLEHLIKIMKTRNFAFATYLLVHSFRCRAYSWS